MSMYFSPLRIKKWSQSFREVSVNKSQLFEFTRSVSEFCDLSEQVIKTFHFFIEQQVFGSFSKKEQRES